MRNIIETNYTKSKRVNSIVNRSIRIASKQLEEFFVRKTQAEKRKALFGEDPLVEVTRS